MGCMDVKSFHSHVGTALPVFTRSASIASSLLPQHGAAIVDFKFGAEMFVLGMVYIFFDTSVGMRKRRQKRDIPLAGTLPEVQTQP